jgi:HK97 gp10 family phage protein
MSESVKFELRGVNEIVAKFAAITDETRRKGGRAALRKAANLVRDAAVANSKEIDDPDTAEQISKNMTVRWSSKLNRQTGDLGFRVGVLGGARSQSRDAQRSARRRRRQGIKSLEELGEIAGKASGNPGGDTWYWRLVEFGTSRSGAKPFMRPALSNNVGAATDTFLREFDKGIDRAIKRASKQ